MDGYTDPIRVDARDLRPGDRLCETATGINYMAGVTLRQGRVLGGTLESLPPSLDGRPQARWTDDRGVSQFIHGELTDAGYPSFPVWARLKLGQPAVVNNATYVEGGDRARAWAEFYVAENADTREVFSGYEAEYRTVHDAGIFRFDCVPDGWIVRGSGDEEFEPASRADDYDPGHIVEARPPRQRPQGAPDAWPDAYATWMWSAPDEAEDAEKEDTAEYPDDDCLKDPADERRERAAMAAAAAMADARPPVLAYAPVDYLNDRAWTERVSAGLASDHPGTNGVVFIPLGTQAATCPPAPRHRSWWRK